MSGAGNSVKLLSPGGCDRDRKGRKERLFNRPGLPALSYRCAAYSDMLDRMLARLSSQTIPPEDPAGSRPLGGLTSRSLDDPAVALLDAWAVVSDVLTFYQERIANERYLRTATERRSVLELARAIGYELNPGVAASTYLAFTVEDAPGAPGKANVPKGTRIQSIPGQDELPQTFETIEEIEARAEWNALRLYEPFKEVSETVEPGTKALRLKGAHTHLKPGDGILLVCEEREEASGSERRDFRILQTVEPFPDEGYTLLTWAEELGYEGGGYVICQAEQPRVFLYQRRAHLFGHDAPDWESLPDEKKKEFLPESPNTITSVAFSSDGNYAATACTDNNLKLWNAETGGPRRTLRGHTKPVTGIAFSPDDIKVISGSEDQTVRIWNVATGDEEHVLVWPGTAITCLAVGVDNQEYPDEEGYVIVAGGENGALKIWRWIATDGQWEADTNFPGFDSSGHMGAVTCVAISSDGKRITSGGEDGIVMLWKVLEGMEIDGGRNHDKAVSGVVFLSEDYVIASSSRDKTVKIWGSGEEWGAQVLEHQSEVTCLTALSSPDSNGAYWILTGCADKLLRLWKWGPVGGQNKWHVIRYYAGHIAPVSAVTMLPNKERFISGGVDGDVKLWEVGSDVDEGAEAAEAIQTFAGHPITDRYPDWPDFAIKASKRQIDLDKVYPELRVGSWIVLKTPDDVEACMVTEASTIELEKYTLAAKMTRLQLDTDENLSRFPLRDTGVHIEGEEYELFTERVKAPVQIGKTRFITLNGLVPGLQPGQALIFSGRRVLFEVAEGAGELQLISEGEAQLSKLTPGHVLEVLEYPSAESPGKWTWHLRDRLGRVGFVTAHEGDFNLLHPEEAQAAVSEVGIIEEKSYNEHTLVALQREPGILFHPASVIVNANVAPATHGETVEEVLGSGDGSKPNQQFTLKKKPLTYVPAETPSGSETTLEVRVDDVLWEEVASLNDLDENSKKYIVRHDDEGHATVIFGDGIKGARLPSGVENVRAVYRSGIGPEGEVAAGSLTLLQNKPLGIKEVTNFLAPSGAAAPESLTNARARAPYTVLTMGRVVSLKDYENFARTVAGIGKAQAAAFQQGETRLVHITIADARGKTVDRQSKLYRTLLNSIRTYRDPVEEVVIDSYQPRRFGLKARVLVDPAYLKEKVHAAVKKALQSAFSFENREFGQEVAASEVTTTVHGVAGVIAMDIDDLYLIGSEGLGDLEELVDQIPAEKARIEGGMIKPAELLLIDHLEIHLEDMDHGEAG